MDAISKAYKGNSHLYGGAYNATNKELSPKDDLSKNEEKIKPVSKTEEIPKDHKKGKYLDSFA